MGAVNSSCSEFLCVPDRSSKRERPTDGRTLGLSLSDSSSAKGRSTQSAAFSLREDDGHDHAIKAESLTKDQDKNQADEDSFLLGVSADASVTKNSNCKTSCLNIKYERP